MADDPALPLLRLAVICEANRCRSVMAEVLWPTFLRTHGVADTIRSAGTRVRQPGESPTPDTLHVLSLRGFDAHGHKSRPIGPWLASADLVLTMTVSQVREVVAFDPALRTRCFALRWLDRHMLEVRPRPGSQPLADWLATLSTRATLAEMFDDGGPFDIPDPTGRDLAAHHALFDELSTLLDHVTAWLWGPS